MPKIPNTLPLSFPTVHPSGYPQLEKEPAFDPARHLALEMPDKVIFLSDLGYSEEEIALCPTPLGLTSPFRILSEEGVACLQEVTTALAPFARNLVRISRVVRGGVYQSKFLRDLCQSPDVTSMLSEICGSQILPHSIPHQMGHLNYNPETVGENIDKWHVDTLRLDYVMFVTDPKKVKGGEFQYFEGTKHQVAELKKQGLPLPLDRIKSPKIPGAGYAVFQQGNMIVHRAKALAEKGERITMVNGYVSADLSYPDYSRFDQLRLADPAHIVVSEYARHVAWLGQQKLTHQIDAAQFSEDRDIFASNLEDVAELLSNAAQEIRQNKISALEHFGDE